MKLETDGRPSNTHSAIARRKAFLVTVWLGLLLPLSSAVAQYPWAEYVPPLKPLVIENVTVIDVVAGRRVPHQTLIVSGNRIAAIGRGASLRRPAGARVINGHGKKYVIPGLWDMHAHPTSWIHVSYPVLLANGVTGIRDAGSGVPLARLRQWRSEVLAGKRLGPRHLFSGPILTSYYPEADPTTAEGQRYATTRRMLGGALMKLNVPPTPADVRRIVDSLKTEGADMIKLYDALDRDVYLAAADEARRVGLPWGGHLDGVSGQITVDMFEASDSGARFLDHLEGGPDCKGDSATLERCAMVAARLRRNDTWLVSTFNRRRPYRGHGICFWPDSLYQLSALGDTTQTWQEIKEAAMAKYVYDRPTSSPQDVVPANQSMAVMSAAGIPFVLGTDMGMVPNNLLGFTTVDELTSLVWNGYTPLAALQAATLNPARALHAADSLGTVAVGKLADLVLLDGDPLADIEQVKQIHGVVANGRYYDRPTLDALLQAVNEAGSRCDQVYGPSGNVIKRRGT